MLGWGIPDKRTDPGEDNLTAVRVPGYYEWQVGRQVWDDVG